MTPYITPGMETMIVPYLILLFTGIGVLYMKESGLFNDLKIF